MPKEIEILTIAITGNYPPSCFRKKAGGCQFGRYLLRQVACWFVEGFSLRIHLCQLVGDLFFENVFDGQGNYALASLFEKGLYLVYRIAGVIE